MSAHADKLRDDKSFPVGPHSDSGGARNGATLWISLDRADETNGSISYLRGVAKKTCAEMFELAMEYQVPCGRFLEGQDVFSDPQIQHNGTILPQEHPVGGSFVTPRPPAQFHGTPSAVGAPASLLGTETDEVLAEFGYTEAEVAAMRGGGVV